MRDSSYYESPVVRVGPDARVTEIADQMERHAVGCVVVTDDERRVLGVVTDRDLLCRVVVPGRDGNKTEAREVMTADPVCGSPNQPLEQIIETMKSARVRRLPIVKDGVAVGLVALDDVVSALASELYEVREAVRSEVLGSRRYARRLDRREALELAVEEIRSQVSQLGSQTRDWLRKEIETIRSRSR